MVLHRVVWCCFCRGFVRVVLLCVFLRVLFFVDFFGGLVFVSLFLLLVVGGCCVVVVVFLQRCSVRICRHFCPDNSYVVS